MFLNVSFHAANCELRELEGKREGRARRGKRKSGEGGKEGRDDLGRPPPADALGACLSGTEVTL